MTIVTKADIFAKISEYANANDRKCPAKDLEKMLGVKTVTERKAFENLLKKMKEGGEILSKKGRGGGLYIADTVNTVVEAEPVEVETDNVDNIDAQPVEFADEILNDQDRSDESYEKLMKMSNGEIPMDEEWVKANWPETWEESSQEDLFVD